jgi:hypothetical protein
VVFMAPTAAAAAPAFRNPRRLAFFEAIVSPSQLSLRFSEYAPF